MKKEIKVLFSLAILTSVCQSIINAFFAPFTLTKNLNESTLGMIISVYSFSIIIITPFISNIVRKFGRKNLFVVSLFLQV